MTDNTIKEQSTHVKYFYMRDEQDLGNIAVTHLSGKDQPADMFIKPLPRPKFEKFRELIGIQTFTK